MNFSQKLMQRSWNTTTSFNNSSTCHMCSRGIWSFQTARRVFARESGIVEDSVLRGRHKGNILCEVKVTGGCQGFKSNRKLLWFGFWFGPLSNTVSGRCTHTSDGVDWATLKPLPPDYCNFSQIAVHRHDMLSDPAWLTLCMDIITFTKEVMFSPMSVCWLPVCQHDYTKTQMTRNLGRRMCLDLEQTLLLLLLLLFFFMWISIKGLI